MALRSSAEAAQPEAGRTVTIDQALPRKAAAELLGTAMLVFFGCGVATVTFGFHAFGGSVAAGVISSSLAFGIVLTALVAIIGPISGSHINPAVTLGALLSRRISLIDAVGYWVAQFIGGILGALLLLWVLHASPFYFKSRIGLAANGWGSFARLAAADLRRRGLPDRGHHHRRVRPRGPERDQERGQRRDFRRRHGPGPHAGEPGCHARRRRLGEPGPQFRPGARDRGPADPAGVAVHPGPAGRRRPGALASTCSSTRRRRARPVRERGSARCGGSPPSRLRAPMKERAQRVSVQRRPAVPAPPPAARRPAAVRRPVAARRPAVSRSQRRAATRERCLAGQSRSQAAGAARSGPTAAAVIAILSARRVRALIRALALRADRADPVMHRNRPDSGT